MYNVVKIVYELEDAEPIILAKLLAEEDKMRDKVMLAKKRIYEESKEEEMIKEAETEEAIYKLKQKAVAVGGILTGLFLAAIEPIGLLACVPFIGLFFTRQKVLVI